VELALNYADRVIGIKNGSIVFDGSAEAVTPEVLSEIYGGRLEEAV
jgi:phosphonate transport system ATP-binding protein